MTTIRRAFSTVTKTVDAEAGIYEATISTESEDRAGDIVIASGGRFDAFMQNPVVLFAHNYRQPPVARALSVTIIPQGVKAAFQFPPVGMTQQADEVHALWRAGFLNATSIGFMPIRSEPLPGHEDDWFPPQKFLEWELLEFSIVPVPANRDALRNAVKAVGWDDILSAVGRVAPPQDELDDAAMALRVLREVKEAFNG